MNSFQQMHEIIPEQEKENFEITHLKMNEEMVKRERMNAAFGGADSYGEVYGLEPGTYVCLRDKRSIFRNNVIMSDTWMEQKTNREIIDKANGDVLIAGLGIGLITLPILKKKSVRTVTIIEKEQEIIDLVAPYLPTNSKVKIICADIFKWEPEQKYDTIYFDIWSSICGDNYPETKKLHKKYRNYLNRTNPKHYMDSWRRSDMKRKHFENR